MTTKKCPESILSRDGYIIKVEEKRDKDERVLELCIHDSYRGNNYTALLDSNGVTALINSLKEFLRRK